MLSLSTVILSLLNSEQVEANDFNRLLSCVRKHEKASSAFLCELKSLNTEDFKRSIVKLAASYKADISKSGLSYAALVPCTDNLHKIVLRKRNLAKAQVCDLGKDIDSFNVARELSQAIKQFDSFLSSIANLKANAANIQALEVKAA